MKKETEQKDKLSSFWMTFHSSLKFAKERSKKYIKELSSDKCYHLSWGDEFFEDSAKEKIYELFLNGVKLNQKNNKHMNKLDAVAKGVIYYQSELINDNRFFRLSTSPCENLINQYKDKAKAEIIFLYKEIFE